MNPHLIARAALASLALATTAWSQSPISITNAGFEDPALDDGGFQNTIPSWNQGKYDVTAPGVWIAGDSGAGVYDVSTSEYSGGAAPQGENMGFTTSATGFDTGISQVLAATLQATAQYDLSVKVGNPLGFNGGPTANWRIELLAGGTLLESATGASPADDSTFLTASLTHNSGATPAQLGQALEIRLLAVNFDSDYEVDFDDVQLTVILTNPVADPGGPYNVAIPSGSLSLDGSASLPSNGHTITTYEWDLDNNGTFGDVTGATPTAIDYATLTAAPPSGYGMVEGANTIKLKVTDSAAKTSTAAATVILAHPSVTYTGPNGAFNKDTWNIDANWDNGAGTVPSGTINVIIGASKYASVSQNYSGVPCPAYDGSLTLEAGATLEVAASSTATDLNALGTGPITLNAGSILRLRYSTASTHSQDFVMAGNATFAIGQSTSAHHDPRTLTGTISGTGQLTIHSTNNQILHLQGDSASWSGGLVAGGTESENKNESIEAESANALGTGDVTLNDGVALQIDAADAIGDGATLSLSGGDGNKSFKLTMNANDSVNMLMVNGNPRPAGTYGAIGSGADHEYAWIGGTGILTVLNAPVDNTPPTVTFAGVGAGGGTTNVYATEPVNYTITFSEPVTPALVETDLENATATAITIGSVTQTSDVAFKVAVTPTEAGTLQLRIKSGTVIQDFFGNALFTPATANDSLTVDALPDIVGQLSVWKPWTNNRINPATGNPWQVGDTYRLAFVTTTTRDAASTNIEDYNAFVQGVADAAGLNAGGATWKVIGSTAAVAARDNTHTNPTTDGTGVAVILMDGYTMFATGNADLWNGSPARPDIAGIFMSPYFNENGVEETTDHSVHTGTQVSGIPEASRVLGGSTETPPKVTTGKVRPNTNGRWLVQFNTNATSALRFFALSDPLTLKSSGATIPYATWAAGPFAAPLTDSTPTLDFDGGGLSTGIEWVVGGDPTVGGDDAGNAPTFDNSDPNNFLFVFKRRDAAAADANTAIVVEYGSDLAGWRNTADHGAIDGVVVDDSTDLGGGFHQVGVAIPRTLAGGGKLFARLKVTVTIP